MSWPDLSGFPHSTGSKRFAGADFGAEFAPRSGNFAGSHRPVSFLGAGSPQQDAANKYHMFFGFDPHRSVKPAEFEYDREFQNLPEAFIGKNPLISAVIISRITKDEQWVLREALPLIRHEKGMRIEWEEWIFNDHMLNRRPEQAVSRLVTSRRDTRSATMTSYGIAGILEHGFMGTTKGRLAYAANLLQFVNAALEVMMHGAQLALLSVDYTKNLRQTVSAPLNSKGEFRKLYERDLRTTAIIQKTPNGIALLKDDFDESFQVRLGKRANYLILGRGAAKYAANHHGLYVPPGSDGLRIKDPAAIDGRMVVREWRPPRGGDDNPRDIDPGHLTTYFGQFFRFSLKYIRNKVQPEHFNMGLMSRKVLDPRTHDYHIAQYQHYLERTGLYQRTRAPNARPRNAAFFGGDIKIDVTDSTLEKGPRWEITSIGKYFMEGHQNWYDYMEAHGVLTPWIRSLKARSPVVQHMFLFDTARYSKRRMENPGNHGVFFNFTKAQWAKYVRALHAGVPKATGAPKATYAPVEDTNMDDFDIGWPTDRKDGDQFVETYFQRLLGPGASRPQRLYAKLIQRAFSADSFNIPITTITREEILADVGAKAANATGDLINQTPDVFADAAVRAARRITAAIVKTGLNKAEGDIIWPIWTNGVDRVASIVWNPGPVGLRLTDVRLPADSHGSTSVHRFTRVLRNIVHGRPLDLEVKDYTEGPYELRDFQLAALTETALVITSGGGTTTDRIKDAADRDLALLVDGAKGTKVDGRLSVVEKQRLSALDVKDAIPLPADMEKAMAPVLHEFGDSVRAIYSKHGRKHFGGSKGPTRFVRLMNWLYEAYRGMPSGEPAFEAMNIFLSEMYLCQIITAGTLFDENRLKVYLDNENKKEQVIEHLKADLLKLHSLRVNIGAATQQVLSKLIANSIYAFMDQVGDLEGIAGQESTEHQLSMADMSPVADGNIISALKSLSITEGDILFFSCTNDLWPLVTMNCYAPSGQFRAWTAVAMRAFGEAGNTIYGHQDIQMGDDPGLKVHTMHYTLYQKAVVSDSRMVEHRNNVMVTEYEGGWQPGEVWDPASQEDREQWERGNYLHKSYFAVPTYPDEVGAENETAQDMMGRANPALMPHFGDDCPIMGKYVCRFWGIQHGPNPMQQQPWISEGVAYSTLCWEQHQLLPQPIGNGAVNPDGEVVVNQGHFGPDFGYPGSSQIFSGQRMYLEKPNYSPTSYRPVSAGYAPGMP